MNWPVVLTTLAFLLAGAALGYAALAAGPLPAATALLFLLLLLARFRSRPEQPGGYMFGAGFAGAIILFKVLAECSPPSCHYEALTPIAGGIFVLIGLIGAGLLVRAALLRRFS